MIALLDSAKNGGFFGFKRAPQRETKCNDLAEMGRSCAASYNYDEGIFTYLGDWPWDQGS